jgi:hypothetical protein
MTCSASSCKNPTDGVHKKCAKCRAANLKYMHRIRGIEEVEIEDASFVDRMIELVERLER